MRCCRRWSLRRTAAAPCGRRDSRWTRCGRSRCRTTGCSGPTIGVWVDARDHVWIIHRSSATLDNNERGAELNPPTGECCKGAPPVLEFDAGGNLVQLVGWARAGLRMAAVQPRHLRRPQGQRLDRRQRRRRFARLKFTRTASSSRSTESPARAKGRSTQRACRPMPATAAIRRTSAASPRSSSTRSDERGLHRRRLPEQARRRARRRYGRDEAILGRVRQQAGRRQPRPLQSRCASRATVPQSRALRGCVERRTRVRLRPGQRSSPGVHAGRQVRQGGVLREAEPGRGSVWDVAFSRDPQQTYIFMADGRNKRVRVIGAIRSRS